MSQTFLDLNGGQDRTAQWKQAGTGLFGSEALAALKSGRLSHPREAIASRIEEIKSRYAPRIDGKVVTHRVPITQPFESATDMPPQRWLKLDLSKAANAGLADDVAGDGKGGWTDQGPFNDMRMMPVGEVTLLGVPFQINEPTTNDGKAIIVLRDRRNLTPPRFSENSCAESIPDL